MKLISATTLIAVLSITSFAYGYRDDSANPQYSKSELHKMIREAHSPDQYRSLAKYFRTQELKYQQQAQTEKMEWAHRAENTTSVAAKYPRPVDSSRNRYEYLMYEADQMNQKAARYDGLAASAQ
jgi:hypothetical protein